MPGTFRYEVSLKRMRPSPVPPLLLATRSSFGQALRGLRCRWVGLAWLRFRGCWRDLQVCTIPHTTTAIKRVILPGLTFAHFRLLIAVVPVALVLGSVVVVELEVASDAPPAGHRSSVRFW